jgi:hypothetical protein
LVRVAERVWKHWRELEEQFGDPSVELLFTSRLSTEEALAALQRAVGDVMRMRLAKADAAAPGEEEFHTGHVQLAPAPGGVVMLIDEEPDDFQALLRGIAEKLDSLGVEGDFDLYQPEPVALPPERVDLIECRLRVRGERQHRVIRAGPHRRGGRKYWWKSDPEALAAGVDAGIGWCLANGTQLPLSLKVRLASPVTLRAEDDLHAYMSRGLAQATEVGVVHLLSVAPERFRALAVDPSMGRVTLIEGGATIANLGWEPSLRDLKGALAAANPWAVYGFIKRGSRWDTATRARSLTTDWVPVPHFYPDILTAQAFEDEWVPDAFGVQLLGAGYAGRLPERAEWRQTPLGPNAVLLEHADPEAWFGRLFGPFGGYRAAPTDPANIPAVVARAREDFAGILFTEEVRSGQSGG